MKRVQLHLSDKQIEVLKKLAKEAGVSFAEMLRRVLDASPMMKQKLIGEIVYPDKENK